MEYINTLPYFKRFLLYVRPYMWMVGLAALGGVIKFSVPLLVPQVTRQLIDGVLLSTELATEVRVQHLIRQIAGLALAFVFIWMPGTYLRHYYAGKSGHSTVFDLRTDLYNHILRMSSSFFDQTKSGGILSRLISDIELAQNLVGNALTNIWMDAAAVVLVLYFLLRIDLGITLVSIALFPVYLLLFKRFGRKIERASYEVQEELSKISGDIQERISGNRVIHAFGQERAEINRFQKKSTHLLGVAMRRVGYQSHNMVFTGIIVQLAPLIVLLTGGIMVIQARLTLGQLVAVTMYLNPLYLPLQRFSELNVVFANSMAAVRRIFEVMDQSPDVKEIPNARSLDNPVGVVKFENVTFRYSEDGPAVLENINLSVLAGTRVALVGSSGAGKSTIASLVPRFYDIADGRITLDGEDIRFLKIKSLRRCISVVTQEPILFSGTIRENILYGAPGASEEALIAAAKAANVDTFVQQLPAGYATEVGERGTFLSGGQKQRITLARAFLKDPRILILDEATSALDAESEQLIQDALHRLMEGRTTFIIAHRLATVVSADQIVVMESGRIEEAGTHDSLLQKNGRYRQFYNLQFQAAHTSQDGCEDLMR